MLTLSSSTIIEHLETTRISSRVPLAFFYCDYRSESAQLPQVVASSLLRQLVARAPVLPQQVLDEQLRSSTSTGHAEALTIDLLSDLVGSVLSCCDGAYLVLDAIDECLDASQRNRLMQVLQQLVLIPGTKVLITGRDHVLEDRDLPGLWAEAPSIRVAAREEDLRLLVQSRLRQRAKRLRLSAALEAKIISAVIDTAHGS